MCWMWESGLSRPQQAGTTGQFSHDETEHGHMLGHTWLQQLREHTLWGGRGRRRLSCSSTWEGAFEDLFAPPLVVTWRVGLPGAGRLQPRRPEAWGICEEDIDLP